MCDAWPLPAIDRIAPTLRPQGKNAGTQRWRELLFIHWAVDAAKLRGLVPAALELDLYDGIAYVGVVPFAMEGVRPRWLPNALAFTFLETNVRLYVHYQGKPGVYFLSLEAASWLAVRAARIGWGLPYHHATMSLAADADDVRTYTSARRRDAEINLHMRYQVGEQIGASVPGSIEHFLVERYLLFTEHRGRLRCGQVHHTPYPVQRAELLTCEESLVAASGLSRANKPTHVHYAAGVDVEVFALHSLDQAVGTPARGESGA